MASITEVIRRLCSSPFVRDASPEARRVEIQLSLFEVPGADPDDEALISRVEKAILKEQRLRKVPILRRLKQLTRMSDREIAEIIGKSRPSVQAYISGRIPENLGDGARIKLAEVVQAKLSEVETLLADIKSQ